MSGGRIHRLRGLHRNSWLIANLCALFGQRRLVVNDRAIEQCPINRTAALLAGLIGHCFLAGALMSQRFLRLGDAFFSEGASR